jgi:predicted transcriptional regulator
MAGTIAEIAAECGVSEQAVRGWCRRNHVAKDAKGSFAISETSETALISMLQKELDRKNEQLSVKDKQIEELNARLAEISSALVVAQQTAQAAQALHAGTIRQQLTDGDADPDVHSQEPEEGEEKKGWLSRLFGR